MRQIVITIVTDDEQAATLAELVQDLPNTFMSTIALPDNATIETITERVTERRNFVSVDREKAREFSERPLGEAILGYLGVEPKIDVADAAQLGFRMGYAERTARVYLSTMVREGTLMRVGSHTDYYYVLPRGE